ncbi:hypothetical protein MYCTH_2096317 [Thermothelomyces thermophilus ATCC 42464]|uniref:Uncharacterized protein n=1 Tax=Thermothelomyces thermophilus (strain ATCC 42464 / BCRC 31852 / DSM 1799) TaxID=573729 RepID=G2QLF4_THET4|nr:uncharacterized protein MYCTH_2096317 [Thermothelomyces thermophilus ATCC 42464]AEO60785.1 hypothetical protein MYCTH_2096317 [Thermothelomyces thermophilus ATCC 42464]
MAPKTTSPGMTTRSSSSSSSSSKGNTKRKPVKPPNDALLAQQYGGGHVGGWVDRLPASVIPYVQLARLSPPAGLLLIFFPHFFGILHAAIVLLSAAAAILRACAITLAGSFFSSNAAHAWNDLVDAPMDRQVARTRGRPVARGAISPLGAFLFAVSQALLAAGRRGVLAACYALPNILAIIYYPYAKRHTHLAQVVLGFCLSYGVVMGSCAMGLIPVVVHIPTVCLMGACLLWTVLYDTVYAHQDVEDDRKLGLKSTAVLLGDRTKPALWCVLGAMLALLAVPGRAAGMAPPYYLFTLGGCLASLGTMVHRVDLKEPASCWWWFRYSFWLAGGSIAAGLVSEYLIRAAPWAELCKPWLHLFPKLPLSLAAPDVESVTF